MINPKELRIGNMISHSEMNVRTGEAEDVIVTVDGNIIKSIELHPWLGYNGIPIDYEKLPSNFKFTRCEEDGEDKIIFDVDAIFAVITAPAKQAFKEYAGNKQKVVRKTVPFLERLPEIIYVHQLQNIFFALTGEELILKK